MEWEPRSAPLDWFRTVPLNRCALQYDPVGMVNENPSVDQVYLSMTSEGDWIRGAQLLHFMPNVSGFIAEFKGKGAVLTAERVVRELPAHVVDISVRVVSGEDSFGLLEAVLNHPGVRSVCIEDLVLHQGMDLVRRCLLAIPRPALEEVCMRNVRCVGPRAAKMLGDVLRDLAARSPKLQRMTRDGRRVNFTHFAVNGSF